MLKRVDVVVHELAPYRAHLIRRFAAEIPELRFRVLQTTEFGGFQWEVPPFPAAVESVLIGRGHRIYGQGTFRRWPAEWRKGGRLIQAVQECETAAVIVCGYGDAGHRRLLRWCHARGIPALLSADSNIRGDRATGLKAFVKRGRVSAIVDRCTAVLPWGTLGLEYFRRYGAQDNKMFLVPHEPDYSLIQSVSPDDVRATRRKLGLDEGRRRVIYCGRLSAEKRVDLLLAAFASLAPQRPEWDLLIVGDGPLSAALRDSVPPDLAGRTTFTGAITQPRELAALYHCADVLVLPSDFEPWGIVINEALAAEMAVVCSDAAGAGADLVRDGVNGRIFASADLPALIECLRDATRKELLPERAAASREILTHWRARHDPVAGLRRALDAAGVLPAMPSAALTNRRSDGS